MADEPGARDIEENRRQRNRQRRPNRTPGRRRQWMEELETLDPVAHARLVELRATNPQAFRKHLRTVAKKHGFYALFDAYGPRELPPPDED